MRRFACAGFLAVVCAAAQARHDAEWSHYVRIAGHSLTPSNAAAIVDESEKTNVFGIETDNDIPGRYESWLNPAEKLAAIRAVAQSAHAAKNKAFVYIAGLECITAHADRSPHSLFKDHPDWVQRKLDGTRAVFGGGVAFWVAPGDEDVWISPLAPDWRKRYMELVRQIAATGIDGVYVDIPYWMTHFEGWEKSWASFDDYTVAAFRTQTGLDARHDIRIGDMTDAGFRKFVDFRIRAITEFVGEIDRNVKEANRHCLTIPEIFPGIEESAPRVGADVYELYPVVDVITHEYQGPGDLMGASKSAFDWLEQMIGMFSFRAFAEGKPSWMLNYSWDGEKQASIPESMKTLFAAQLTAGANSWDAQGHVMSKSNDPAVRTEVFGWIAKHEDTFYDAREPVDPVGVYFSPQTRNYFPEKFMASFKGFMSLLLLGHREFQIVTPRTLAGFRGRLLILPSVSCVSEEEAAEFGHHQLLIAGASRTHHSDGSPAGQGSVHPDPGADFDKLLRSSYAHAAELGKTEGAVFLPPVQTFLKQLPPQPGIEVEGSLFVLSQIARVHGTPHVFLDNFAGIVAKQRALPRATSGVSVSFPASAGSHVYVLPFLGETKEIASRLVDGQRVAQLAPFIRSMVVWCR